MSWKDEVVGYEPDAWLWMTAQERAAYRTTTPEAATGPQDGPSPATGTTPEQRPQPSAG